MNNENINIYFIFRDETEYFFSPLIYKPNDLHFAFCEHKPQNTEFEIEGISFITEGEILGKYYVNFRSELAVSDLANKLGVSSDKIYSETLMRDDFKIDDDSILGYGNGVPGNPSRDALVWEISYRCRLLRIPLTQPAQE
ncbi:hypothetical protein CL622_08535 [archaeon]|nr:hypothetical protein [archaeon]|tara:strand:+ start:3838 stop:4257 length:420 start_codon:yes stop_codon:yes gene_type:complete